MKARVQHPKIRICKDRGVPYYFFRYREDVIQPDGSVETPMRRRIVGYVKGTKGLTQEQAEKALTKKEAEIARDKFLATINCPTPQVAVAKGVSLFREVAQMYITSHVQRENKHSLPHRLTLEGQINSHLIPKWGDRRLNEIGPREIEDWLYSLRKEPKLDEDGNVIKPGERVSWHLMRHLKIAMGAIYNKAAQWGYWDENRKPPTARVDIGRKVYKHERKVLSLDETARVLARLEDPNLLICETCFGTSTRISEVTGLQLKHVDLNAGTIHIEQRHWHGDIADPKTDGSRRILALGALRDRYREWIGKLGTIDPNAWVFPQIRDATKPMWDSGVRKALKIAAEAEGCDFPYFGLHTLRRESITLRQEVGGSAIEASKIAGHANLDMTGHYTFVAIERQDALVRAIQERLTKATERAEKKKVVLIREEEVA